MDVKKAKGIATMLEDRAEYNRRRYEYILADLMDDAAAVLHEEIRREEPMEPTPAGDEVICPACNTQGINDGRYCKWCGQRLK